MNLKQTRSRSRLQLLCSLLVTFLILVVGVLLLILQTRHGMEAVLQQRLSSAMQRFDAIFSLAQNAADGAAPLAGRNCDADVQQKLRYLVVALPYVRSVNLVRGKTIYCTSLYGPVRDDWLPEGYGQGRLNLMDGNAITPDSPLLVLRRPAGDNDVLVGIEGFNLYSLLAALGTPSSPLQLQIGEQWLHSDGRIGREPPAGESVVLASKRFPYRLAAVQSRHAEWNEMWLYARESLLLLVFLSAAVGGLAYYALGKTYSPVNLFRQALRNGEFVPYLQPVFHSRDGRLGGCEVLVRWLHPQLGLRPPDQFIPLAEDTGIVVPMTRALMQQVREEFAPVADRLPPDFHFSFNISASHCHDMSLADDCAAFLAAFPPDSIQLVLELTERELLVPTEQTRALFTRLRAMGVLNALDDFGTGHATLAYLQQFRFDILKIDRSFVQSMGSDTVSAHIVDNVIDLARRLELKTVAEGVETEQQRRELERYPLDYLQGYLLVKPTDCRAFIHRWLHTASDRRET